MLTRRFVQSTLAILVLVAMLCQGTLVLAGTTGQLSGTAVDSTTNAPLAGAKVTVASPSQISSTTTDSGGRFNFLALAPDTYTVSIELQGYQPTSLSGVTVIADNARTVSISAAKELKTIGSVRTRASTSLVKPGTTSDVYSVDATTQSKVAGVGGGAELNNAYSAIATVPGAFVPQGAQDGNGIGPGLYIRGGDYDQVGFEIDGVPVNRSFDNYPSGPASSLGQQEVQVYTGSAPANAEGQGLAGFINQVIKIGTYPGYVDAEVGLGGPAYYHKAGIEIGGATADRRFSYFVAADGYNQDFRYADQYNGASLQSLHGTPVWFCGLGQTQAEVPSCFTPNGTPYFDRSNPTNAFALGPYNWYSLAQITNRNDVVNLHYGFPHKDGSKDDIQFLAEENFVSSQYYNSINDEGGLTFASINNDLGAAPFYVDGYQYNGPTGVALPANYRGLTTIYNQPGGAAGNLQSPSSGFDSPIPLDLRDAIANDQGIAKLQFTKSLGSNALFKLYGYTYYSDWLQDQPQSGFLYFHGFGYGSADYELSSHTRGLSGTFSDQLNAQNLLQLQGSFTTSNAIRDNNSQQENGNFIPSIYGDAVTARTALAVLVNANNPLGGLCYTSTGKATTCAYGAGAQFATLYEAYSGTITPVPGGAATCGGGPCEYLTIGNGQYATYNQVVPKFTSFSLTDQFRPTSKLNIDLGIRDDIYQFQGSDTSGGPARQFWYNAYNLDNCVANTPAKTIVDKVSGLGLASPNDPCPAGYSAANFVNPSGAVTQSYTEFQPRAGFTYSLDPTTVLRGSYGRYSQAPNTAFEQYNALQPNAPALLYGTYGFQKFGFTSPDHPVVPEVSNNFDFSIEKSFGDTSVKVTPFLRKTQNQIQQFYLNQAEGFVSGLNVGNQTSQGVEFELDKGNFARDGIAAKLAFTYTNSYIRYNATASGGTVLDNINQGIQGYNAYTSQCAVGGKYAGTSICGGTQTGAVAAPCYKVAPTFGGVGAPAPGCGPGTVANPYWNAPAQPLLDDNADYPTYDVFPAGIGTAAASYGAPYFATFILQYKHGPLAVTPNVTFSAGTRYGSPLSTVGIAPDECGALVPGTTATDPRYPYGATGGSPFSSNSCGQLSGGQPDPYTGKFDNLGAFVQPSVLAFGTQLQYDFTKRFSLVATLANIVNTCFGGSKTGFSTQGACGYGVVASGITGDIGNNYNPGDAIQPLVNTPYDPYFAGYPFSFYLTAKVKI